MEVMCIRRQDPAMARPKRMVEVAGMGMITWALKVLATGPRHREVPVATEMISTRRALATEPPTLGTVQRQDLELTARPHPVDGVVMEMLMGTRAPRVLATKTPSQTRMAQRVDLATILSRTEVLVAVEKVIGTGRTPARKAPTPSTVRRRGLDMARPNHSEVLAVGTEMDIKCRNESDDRGTVRSSNCEPAECSV